MTSKQRSYLKGLAMNIDSIFQIGKSSLTPEITAAVDEALEARELIKVKILETCTTPKEEIAQELLDNSIHLVCYALGGIHRHGEKHVYYYCYALRMQNIPKITENCPPRE